METRRANGTPKSSSDRVRPKASARAQKRGDNREPARGRGSPPPSQTPKGNEATFKAQPAPKQESAADGRPPSQKAAAQLVVGTAGASSSVLPAAVTGMGEIQNWGSALIEQVGSHLFPKTSPAEAQRGMFGFWRKGNDQVDDSTSTSSTQQNALEKLDPAGINGDVSVTEEAKRRYQKLLKQHPELLDGVPVNPYVLLGHPLSDWVQEELHKAGLQAMPMMTSLSKEGMRHVVDAEPRKEHYRHVIEAHPREAGPILLNKTAPSIHWQLRDDEPGKTGAVLDSYLLWTDANGIKHKIETFNSHDFAIKTSAEFTAHQAKDNPALLAIPQTFVEPQKESPTPSFPFTEDTGKFLDRDKLTSLPNLTELLKMGYHSIPLPQAGPRYLNLLKNERHATDVIQFETRRNMNEAKLVGASGSLAGRTGAIKTTYQFDPSSNSRVLSNKILAQTDFNRDDPNIFDDANFDLRVHFAQRRGEPLWD
jgi:hypothetical protein